MNKSKDRSANKDEDSERASDPQMVVGSETQE
jgi:hypothetical protein